MRINELNRINVWDWRFKIFFKKDLLNEIVAFARKLVAEEEQVYKDIIEFYTSFYTISGLLDIIEEDGDYAKEYIAYAKQSKEKVLYTPSIIRDAILERISKQHEDLQSDLLDIFEYTKIQSDFVDLLSFFKKLYGEVYLDFNEITTYVLESESVAVNHGEPVPCEEIKSEFYKCYEKIVLDEDLVDLFGKSCVSEFDIIIEERAGFAEWWDRSLCDTSKDTLVLCSNKDLLNYNDFKYTIVHEVYPGHGHFYNNLGYGMCEMFDHGALSLIEGWATFVEWNTIKSEYVEQIRKNSKQFLRESMISDLDKKAVSIYDAKILQGFSYEEALRTVTYATQYLGFIESYYLGALWIETYCKVNCLKPKDFLNKLRNNTIGDLFRLWK